MANREQRRNGKVHLLGQEKEPESPRATLGFFAYAGVVPETADCLLRDMRAWPNLTYARISGDALIDRSRSRMASSFLQAPREDVGDVLLMLDHDIQWMPGDLQGLAKKCLETKGVVAGVYAKRNFGVGTAVRFAGEGEYVQGTDVLAPATYVSTGFIAIHRDVLEAVKEKVPYCTIGSLWPMFIPMVIKRGDGETEELSEDWAFCERAREQGFPIHAWMYPRLTHIGNWGFRLIDSQVQPQPDSPIKIVVRGAVESKVLSGLPRDVAEYSGTPPDALANAFVLARQGLSNLWLAYGGFDHEVEAAWYRREDVGRNYVLDLGGWHMMEMQGNLEAFSDSIKTKPGKRALDFGSGIGTTSLLMAEAGVERVEMVEVNPTLREFTRLRAEKLGLADKVAFVEAPTGAYDTVVCWHVLEHVADPQAVADLIVSHMADNAILFTDSDFHADPIHPMHHTEGGNGAVYWEQAGLTKLGDHWWAKGGAGLESGEGVPAEEPVGSHTHTD